MPLFNKHHGGPADSAGLGHQPIGVNDFAYNEANPTFQQDTYSSPQTAHPSNLGAAHGAQTTTQTSGVGGSLGSSHGTRTALHPSGVGAPTDQPYDNHSTYHHNPGAATVGSTTEAGAYNQPTTGYSDGPTGRGQLGATLPANGVSAKEAKSMEMKGKAQQLAGLVLSSETLKSKGLAKEQEAIALRQQGENLERAERHEVAAREARERAVAHGADPAHGTLGGTRF